MVRAHHGVLALIAAALTSVALVTAGCAGADRTGGQAPPTDPPPAADPTTPPATDPAEPSNPAVPETLAFQAGTVDGGQLDAATLAGQPVAFWFWAAWCPRCAAAASEVRAVQAEYAGRAHLVGVAGLGSGTASMRDFVDRHDLGDFPHLADDDGAVWRRFGVTAQEYFVLLDASGAVVHQGPLTPQALRDRLDDLVG